MHTTTFTTSVNGEIKKNYLQKTWVVCALALVCTFLWGSASPCIKLGYALFQIPSSETWTQVLFAGTRFVFAGVLTILIGSALNRKMLVPTKSSIPSIAKLGLFQTILQYIFFYIGLAHNSGVKASIINGSNTFFVIILAGLVFHQEKLSLKKIAGCIIGFAGVIVVSMNGKSIDMNLSLMGDGSLFLCAISYGVSSCLMKNYSKKDNPVMLSGYQFIFGGIVMIILGLLMGGRITHVSVSAILMLFYLACISAVAYSLWGILLKHNPVSKVAIFGFTNPVFGVLLSAWWLGEGGKELGINALIALILVCIGILIVNVHPKEAG
ncbi:MAG: DMT family transporter [Eubacteriales bacterium]|nr:DMT family transporter [Eubacteriales bacterium]